MSYNDVEWHAGDTSVVPAGLNTMRHNADYVRDQAFVRLLASGSPTVRFYAPHYGAPSTVYASLAVGLNEDFTSPVQIGDVVPPGYPDFTNRSTYDHSLAAVPDFQIVRMALRVYAYQVPSGAVRMVDTSTSWRFVKTPDLLYWSLIVEAKNFIEIQPTTQTTIGLRGLSVFGHREPLVFLPPGGG